MKIILSLRYQHMDETIEQSQEIAKEKGWVLPHNVDRGMLMLPLLQFYGRFMARYKKKTKFFTFIFFCSFSGSDQPCFI